MSSKQQLKFLYALSETNFKNDKDQLTKSLVTLFKSALWILKSKLDNYFKYTLTKSLVILLKLAVDSPELSQNSLSTKTHLYLLIHRGSSSVNFKYGKKKKKWRINLHNLKNLIAHPKNPPNLI